MSSMVSDDSPKPRLCHLKKRLDFQGYGFNLHAEKGKAGQYIGKVDENSPAEDAGLKQGDRIVEVNGTNIGNENHQQVVQRIKAVPDETKLLVVDAKADNYYKEKKIVVRGDMPGVLCLPADIQEIQEASTVETVAQVNHDVPTVNGDAAQESLRQEEIAVAAAVAQAVASEDISDVKAEEPVVQAVVVNGEAEQTAQEHAQVAPPMYTTVINTDEQPISEDVPPPREDTPPPREATPPPREPTPPPREPTPPPREPTPPPREPTPPPREPTPPPAREDTPPPRSETPPPAHAEVEIEGTSVTVTKTETSETKVEGVGEETKTTTVVTESVTVQNTEPPKEPEPAPVAQEKTPEPEVAAAATVVTAAAVAAASEPEPKVETETKPVEVNTPPPAEPAGSPTKPRDPNDPFGVSAAEMRERIKRSNKRNEVKSANISVVDKYQMYQRL